MKKRRHILFIMFLFGTGVPPVFAQPDPEIDSLEALLKTDKEDTGKVIHASRLCWKYWASGRYDTAAQYGNTALQLALKLNYIPGIATSYNNTGLVYYSRGNYTQAHDYFFNALKAHEKLLAEAAKSKNAELIKSYKNETARNLGNIGLVYDIQEEYAKAEGYYLKALTLFEELGNQNKVCAALGNMANVYMDMGNIPKALDYYFRALKMAEELGNQNAIGRTLGNIGSVYSRQKDFEKALTYFFSALKIAKEIGDKNRVAIWFGNIGFIYISQKKYTEAEDFLLRAQKMYEGLDDMYGQMDIHSGLSELYEKRGNFKLALEHYEKSMTMKDSLFNEEKNKELTRKEMNYEFEKKEMAARADQEKKEAVAAEENRKQRFVLVLVCCVLALVLIFAGFIFRSLRITRRQKQTIEHQKKEVEEKQKEILDSIYYARRIQTALLPMEKYIDKTLKRLMRSN